MPVTGTRALRHAERNKEELTICQKLGWIGELRSGGSLTQSPLPGASVFSDARDHRQAEHQQEREGDVDLRLELAGGVGRGEDRGGDRHRCNLSDLASRRANRGECRGAVWGE